MIVIGVDFGIGCVIVVVLVVVGIDVGIMWYINEVGV